MSKEEKIRAIIDGLSMRDVKYEKYVEIFENLTIEDLRRELWHMYTILCNIRTILNM